MTRERKGDQETCQEGKGDSTAYRLMACPQLPPTERRRLGVAESPPLHALAVRHVHQRVGPPARKPGLPFQMRATYPIHLRIHAPGTGGGLRAERLRRCVLSGEGGSRTAGTRESGARPPFAACLCFSLPFPWSFRGLLPLVRPGPSALREKKERASAKGWRGGAPGRGGEERKKREGKKGKGTEKDGGVGVQKQ